MGHAAGIPFAEATRVAGVADRLGRLEAEMDASLTVIEPEGEVSLTMVKGSIVFHR